MSKYKCKICGDEFYSHFSYQINDVLCYKCNQIMIKECDKSITYLNYNMSIF